MPFFYQIVTKGTTVVEHLPNHFKDEVLIVAAAVGTRREKMK